eukprot:3861895-Alexandrium_andersonii.AAC.1
MHGGPVMAQRWPSRGLVVACSWLHGGALLPKRWPGTGLLARGPLCFTDGEHPGSVASWRWHARCWLARSRPGNGPMAWYDEGLKLTWWWRGACLLYTSPSPRD